jgi:hypothetical protein
MKSIARHLEMTASHRDVEFKTLDGLTLKAWFYPAAAKGPCIIMSHGVNNPPAVFIHPSRRIELTKVNRSSQESDTTTSPTSPSASKLKAGVPSSTTIATSGTARASQETKSIPHFRSEIISMRSTSRLRSQRLMGQG